MAPTTPALEVALPPTTYCSGSYVGGEVHINFRHLQHDKYVQVWVTLRGQARSIIKHGNSTECDTIPLLELTRVLWTYGAEYPPPETDILRLFFRFELPSYLPPSFYHSSSEGTGAILYCLTVVGVRPGNQSPRVIHIPIVILPQDDFYPPSTPPWSSSSLALQTTVKEKAVRKGLWGDPATVRVEFSLPDIPVYPLFTPIPYTIDITTTTAVLFRWGAGASSSIFPAPPTTAGQFILELVRRTTVRVEDEEHTFESTVTQYLGLNRLPSASVEMDLPDKEWMGVHDPDANRRAQSGNARGMWVQRSCLRSSLTLDVPPMFNASDMIECEYFLKLRVPFPGRGNDVELDVPITVVSGVIEPRARKEHVPRLQYPCSSGSPLSSEVFLPSEYWDVRGSREWQEFTRGIKPSFAHPQRD
ncbi:hypothetical protein L226DRAFT_208167 [Lentinus tigrinus ALCF2SS1-7]|uniref:Arrestin-like N-terminal domain-containing protein n=1 Tax=Lentinus tigrinus ALCF2SS1-6 TaxID=1328759 RepID=A0A5C2RUT4_9APHY|nr:hypothetical protein L227DRAFT_309946 [Lentinus tigrinus ALCF2SS1-6]RPD71366.1 hypothetical protein L226DRAFT_208167 [Lentinus tigrinus ALCF2SS1-7]